MISTLKDIARDSHLRVAINTGNRALVQRNGDHLIGISPVLARRLADEMVLSQTFLTFAGSRDAAVIFR